MPKRVSLKPHYNALKMLSKAKKAHYRIIIQNTPTLPKIIRHLSKYILNGTIKLQKKHVAKLKPHRNFIRKIASAGSQGAIKGFVLQKGGSILKSILNTVLPLIPSLLL